MFPTTRTIVCTLLVAMAVPAFAADPKTPDEAAIRKLIDQLGDDDFDKRETAAKRLEAIGIAALPLLRKTVAESKDAEQRARADELAAKIAKSAFVQVRVFDKPNLRGPRRWISRVVVTPDGKQAITGGDECLIVWDIATGKVVRTFGKTEKAYWALALSRDGKRLLATGDGGMAAVWDVETGKEIIKLTGHKGDVWGAALSGDAKRAVTGSFDGSVIYWNVETATKHRSFDNNPSNQVRCLALSPDEKCTAFGQGVFVCYANLMDKAKPGWAVPGASQVVSGVAFAPDGKSIVTCNFDGILRLWNVSDGKQLRVFKGHTSRVESVAFSPDGKFIVSCGDEADETVRVWDAATGQQLYCSEKVPGGFIGIAVLPDSQHALTTGKDSRVRLWRWSK